MSAFLPDVEDAFALVHPMGPIVLLVLAVVAGALLLARSMTRPPRPAGRPGPASAVAGLMELQALRQDLIREFTAAIRAAVALPPEGEVSSRVPLLDEQLGIAGRSVDRLLGVAAAMHLSQESVTSARAVGAAVVRVQAALALAAVDGAGEASLARAMRDVHAAVDRLQVAVECATSR